MASPALLRDITFGARVAEEETSELATYFVETDQWKRIVRGEIDVVRGEKGAGKSAIYSLLITRGDFFFDENILLVSAEKPRGTPVFKGLVGDPPPTEDAFVSLWKLYLVTLVAERLRAFGISGSDADRLLRALEDEGLLESEFDLGSLFRLVVSYTKRWLNPEVLDFSISADAGTGIPKLDVHIQPGGVNKQEVRARTSVDELFSLANSALKDFDRTVWILLDRLDVAFIESHQLEKNALRALFRVYLDLNEFQNIKLKIFIRSDIWRRITEEGFREASHITRAVTLDWSSATLLNLIIRRLLSNKKFIEQYGIDKDAIINNFEYQKNLFYTVFPAQVEQGTRKPSTLDWMITRCADGTDKAAPREVIHLLTALRDEEIRRLERGEPLAPDKQLVDRAVFKVALPHVSEARLVQTLYAEYPDLKKFVDALIGEKTEQTSSTLAVLWKTDEGGASVVADRLVEVGFFQRRGERTAVTYWVTFLYRDALKMVQGLAEDAT